MTTAQKYSRPSRSSVGAGEWYFWSQTAREADQVKASGIDYVEKKKMFFSTFRVMQRTFPCEKCRRHMLEFYNRYPNFEQTCEEKGYFYMVWLLHNEVNRENGKEEISYEEALDLNTPILIAGAVCEADCDEPDGTPFGSVTILKGHETSYTSVYFPTIIPKPVNRETRFIPY